MAVDILRPGTPREPRVPPKYRRLYYALRGETFTVAELEWLLKSDPNLPQLIVWTITEKLRLLAATAPEVPTAADRAEDQEQESSAD